MQLLPNGAELSFDDGLICGIVTTIRCMGVPHSKLLYYILYVKATELISWVAWWLTLVLQPCTSSDCAPVFVVDASNVLGKGKVVNHTTQHSTTQQQQLEEHLQ